MAERPEFRIRTNARGMEFLQRVATDPAYRSRLETTPAEALAEYGFEIPPDEMPSAVELPPEDEIRELLAQASEPDEFGNVEFPTASSRLFRLLGLEAMVFVADEEDVHAR